MDEIAQAQLDADVARLISERQRRESANQYWQRMYSMDAETVPFASIIRASELPDLMRAMWYAREFGQDWLADLVAMSLAMHTSVRGKARTEAVKAMTGSPEEKTRSILRLRKAQG